MCALSSKCNYSAVNSEVWEYRLFSALFSCTIIEASEREEGKGVSLHVVKTEWEVKNFHTNFYDVLETGGVETKRHMTFFREQIELRVAPKIAGVSH